MIDTLTKSVLSSALKKAGEELKRDIYKDSKKIEKLSVFDYGIKADKAAEKIILKAISNLGLECKIISEESSLIGNSKAKYTIYLDPLDGTVNFSRGIPTYCMGIGIYDKLDPLIGIVFDPSTNELFIAEKEKGITLNGEKIVPYSTDENELIQVEWFGSPLYEKVIIKLKQNNIRVRSAGSGVLALVYGCIGRGDGAILLDNNPWDIAPGLAFAYEAGYVVCELDGNSVDLNKTKLNIIAAPERLLKKIQSILNNY